MSDLKTLNVVVLAGGPGSERDVSLASGNAVLEALEGRCGSVSLLDVPGEDFELPEGTDLVFNVIHGTFGEDGTLQKILDSRRVPYTGAGEASSRLAFDKVHSKEKFVKAGVRSPAYEVLELGQGANPSCSVPCVVKPPREGSSVGVHIVKQEEELAAAFEDVSRYSQAALVEEFIAGKELTVGVLGTQALPIVHIQPRSGFYDINNKYPWLNSQGGTDYFCPADLPEEVTREVQEQALRAHQALGIEIYSRVDVLLDEQQVPYVLEVNTIPGMTASSLLPKAAAAQGIDFPSLCQKIGEASLRLRGG